ncbi:hypothetical protein YDYSY3_27750 [Paenibacillus chitinolyticus]|uniref:TetR/AcrR family transcriptional regulator n=1 Tax=Paenibacillus chitinolyticus TaxID=79263 RepID=UPI0026E4E705|nr:TetR/AcrR family transcriptional regulator [Paenibacillus chitinolyticus]GKS11775.1 hypothetical protein YDYSY3_27750 [Paenibacillus chitinolyticus]
MKKWEAELDDLRVKRRDQILEAAKEIFLEKDIASITMAHIAAHAGVTRVTLYNYFSSIHEIVFEIQIKIINEITGYSQTEDVSAKTGADQLALMINDWLQLYREHPDHLRFIAQFDHFYRDSFPSEELRERYKKSMESRGSEWIAAIEKGMKDGSVLRTFDPVLLGSMISHTLTSMVLRMATRGHLIQKQFGLDPEQILTYLTNFLSQFVRAKPDPSIFELERTAE